MAKTKLAKGAETRPIDELRPGAARSVGRRCQAFLGMSRWLFLEGPGAVQMGRLVNTASEADQAKAAELLEHIHAANQLAEELSSSLLPPPKEQIERLEQRVQKLEEEQ